MKYKLVDGMLVSELCLGGGKMVDMDIDEGKSLLRAAWNLGISTVDCHHRYGNCETIVGEFKEPLVVMSKVSAYTFPEYRKYGRQTLHALGRSPDIYWVSDLDDRKLYTTGLQIYRELREFTGLRQLGITSENPKLLMQFMDICKTKYLMFPVYLDGPDMSQVIERAHREDRIVFSIKPFDDGRSLEKYTVERCLLYQKQQDVDIVVFGTRSTDHLKEVVDIWGRL